MNYSDYNDETLLDIYQELTDRQKDARDIMGHIEMVLRQRLQERGANEIPHPTLSVRLEARFAGYDISKMMTLKELVSPEVWAEAYTPAYVKEVPMPETLDARKAGGWGKRFGPEVAAVVEAAELPRTVRLVIKPKKALQEV